MLILLAGKLAFCQYKMVYIPDSIIGNMKMDGDTTDWEWAPSSYIIKTNSLDNMLNDNEYDPENWACRLVFGWNQISNRIYILAIVKDDVKSVDRIPPQGKAVLDDCMEVIINPDNFGGENRYQTTESYHHSVKFFYSFPLPESKYEFEIRKGPSWYPEGKRYISWGGKEYNDPNHKTVTVYEVSLILWDFWSDKGAEYSQESQLFINKQIGLTVAFDDVDKEKDVRSAQWVTSSGSGWNGNANDLSVFILDAPLKKGISWQNISHLLK